MVDCVIDKQYVVSYPPTGQHRQWTTTYVWSFFLFLCWTAVVGFPLIYLINGLTLDTPFVQDECIYMRLGVFFLPLFGLPVLFVLLFGAFVSPHFDFCVSWFRCLSFFLFEKCIWVAGVRMLCLSRPVRWRALHCLLPLQNITMYVISLCRSLWPRGHRACKIGTDTWYVGYRRVERTV